jgi:hypothetical protein
MRRLAAPFLILMTAGLLGMGTAAAVPLPTITVDPTYGPPLTIVKVAGRSFCATCGPVTLSVSTLNVDTAPVRADGTFSRIIRIPGSSRPGTVTIEATQGTSTARASFTVTVNQPAPTTYPAPKTLPPPGNLPGGSVTGTPARTTASPATATSTPGATTTSPRPSGSTTGGSASPGPTAVTPVAGHRPSGHSSAWPVAALATAAALLAAGTAWWLRRRRAQTNRH